LFSSVRVKRLSGIGSCSRRADLPLALLVFGRGKVLNPPWLGVEGDALLEPMGRY
jgi:hypothetical protein